MPMSAKKHYNHVTDAWKEFMGDNFHFGYFETEQAELPVATNALIDKMAGLCRITNKSKILDVGCGIGEPALYIHKKFRCAVTGISTSERGVELASRRSRELGYGGPVSFRVADGMDNGFPDQSFDIAWVMESSHLMADKKKLFRECFRVLKNNGAMVLCDIVLLEVLPFVRLAARNLPLIPKYAELARTWGYPKVNSMGTYCNGLIEAGFSEVTAINITEKTLPTMRRWIQNARAGGEKTMGDFTRKDVMQFIRGCEVLDEFFRNGIAGYGMMMAKK
jgi:ubiquinone/menaquinone biosynthesis C-methylase UbiE